MIVAFALFVAAALLNVAWVRCVAAVADKRAISAALYSGFVHVIGVVSVLLIVDSWWLVVPTVGGDMFGTWLGVRRHGSC